MIIQSKLPADPIALVLGIISLVLLFLGCCCGLFSIVSLALSIIGLVTAQKSLREYELSPESYSKSTKDSVTAGKIICVVGTIISALITLVYVVYFAIAGALISDEVWRKWDERMSERNTETFEDTIYKVESDTVSIDTTYKDSIIVKEVK